MGADAARGARGASAGARTVKPLPNQERLPGELAALRLVPSLDLTTRRSGFVYAQRRGDLLELRAGDGPSMRLDVNEQRTLIRILDEELEQCELAAAVNEAARVQIAARWNRRKRAIANFGLG